MFSAYSQTDTTHAWERVPCYYYEDTNWWDHYCFKVAPIEEGLSCNLFARFPLGGSKTEFARHCHTDTTLRVVGVAAAITYSLHDNTLDTVMSHRPAEYLRLYDADGDGMTLLGEARCDTSSVRRRIAVEYWRFRDNESGYHYEEELRDVYEVYFDEPVEVEDSFYVSGTQYGNQTVEIVDTVTLWDGSQIPRTSFYYLYPVSCFWKTAAVSNEPHYPLPSRPGYYKSRELGVDPTSQDGEWRYMQDGGFLNIFPIIDTSCITPHDNGQQSNTLNTGSVLDEFTYIMPNPARGRVTVASSFRIGKVTVCDAAGNTVISCEPKEMSVSFDVSMLPKGIYVVTIATNRGIVHKRLIVD